MAVAPRHWFDLVRECAGLLALDYHIFAYSSHPQSDGKIKRFHRTPKEQATCSKPPLTQDYAKRIATEFIDHYNKARPYRAIAFVSPTDRPASSQPRRPSRPRSKLVF